MQSILLATPSKASKSEISHENKLYNEGASVQDKDGSVKGPKGFASVLEKTVLESKERESKELQSKKLGNKTLQSKSSEGKELPGKELEAKGSKDEHVEKTAQTKNAKSLNNELVSKVLSNEEKPKDGKSDPLLPEKNQVSEFSNKTLKSDSSELSSNVTVNAGNASTEMSKTDSLLVQESKDPLLDFENTDAVATVLSTDEKLNNALSANNAQTTKKELDATVIAPIESDIKQKMTKADHSFSSKDDLNVSEKLSKEGALAGDKVAPAFKASLIKESDSALSASGQVTSSEETLENSASLIKNTSDDIDKLSMTLGNVSSVDKANQEVSKASTKAVISEQENKSLEGINLSEEASEIELADGQNILNNEGSRNLREQEQQLKGINIDNAVANNNEPQVSPVTNNKLSEEEIEAGISSTDSEVVNLATLIDDVKSLKEVSQSEENNNQEITDQAFTDSDLEVNDVVVNPILAQIQTAQKTDTKVSDNTLQTVAINNIEKGNKKDGKSTSKNVDKDFIKMDKNNVENVLADASEKSTLVEKDLNNKANISANEKIEGMLANFRSEAAKPFFNQSAESHSLNSLGVASASADKLLHQVQSNATNPTLQSSALQQPLELQAKHASAMVGERIMMMLNQGKQEVTIRLDPAELGSMHIKLHVQQDQLQVTIQTQVGQSRDIIEQNLPRLREQLAQQGINLGEASVEQQGRQQQSNSQDSSQMGRSAQGMGSQGETFVEEQSEFFPTQIPLPAQGIDYYA